MQYVVYGLAGIGFASILTSSMFMVVVFRVHRKERSS